MQAGIARVVLITVSLGLMTALAACGGEVDLTCDDPGRYQQAVENDRLRAPNDLHAPEAYLEMPVPEANPRPERPEGSPCLDLPPRLSPSD